MWLQGEKREFPRQWFSIHLSSTAFRRHSWCQYGNTPGWLTMEKVTSLTWTSLYHTQAMPAPEGRQLALERWLSQGYQGFLCTFGKSLQLVLARLHSTYPDFHRITESHFHLFQDAWSSNHKQWLREIQKKNMELQYGKGKGSLKPLHFKHFSVLHAEILYMWGSWFFIRRERKVGNGACFLISNSLFLQQLWEKEYNMQ